MVNNSSMGYRGELLVIFKNRSNIHLCRCVEDSLMAINQLKHVTNRIEEITNDCMKELEQVMNGFPYKEGDRICQLLVRRREKIQWEEVETLEELGTTERGEGGFGSTGGIGEAKVEETTTTENTESQANEEPAKVSGTTQNRFAK